MQAIPAMAVMPKNPGNAAQSSGVENDSASIEGVDFSSMLKAQINGGQEVDAEAKARLDAVSVEFIPVDSFMLKAQAQAQVRGGQGVGLEIKASLETVSAELALVEVGEQQELDSLPGEELALNSGLIPLTGIFMPIPIPVAVGKPSALPEKVLEGVKGGLEVLGQFSKESPGVKAASLDSGRQAEFAVDGEILPQGRVDRGGEVLRQPLLPVESPLPASTLSAMMAASQPALAETKSSHYSPLTLQAPLGSSDWNDAFGQKVVWLAGQQTQVAELRLNPPHLGPMEVRLSVSNDQISAIFVSHQSAVREAIEAAMPRLREMFADGGLTLGNATVSSDTLPQQQMAGREGQSGSARKPVFSEIGNMHSSQNIGGVIPLRQDGSGMVDLFA